MMRMDGVKKNGRDLRKLDLELKPRWVREHPEEAGQIFNSVPVADQAQLALTRRGKDRMELILLSHQARGLVHRLPESELYFTIKELGEEDSLPILALAGSRQLTYIFDLEFWDHDRLIPEKILQWLDRLRLADEDQFQNWIKKADQELLIGALQKLVQVLVVDPDNLGAEPWREQEVFTLDEQYYFLLSESKFRPIVERILITLREIDPEKFYSLLDQVRMVLSSEVEETAHRVRQGRLEDYGFYTFDQAFEIYRYLSPAQMERLIKNPERPEPVKAGGARYPVLVSREVPSFLAESLKALSDLELEDFYCQFALLANQVMIADLMDLTDLDTLKRAAEKVYGYLELGLGSWSKDDPVRALEILQRQWLQHIFQAGFSRALKLRFRAQRLVQPDWFRSVGKPFHLFGEPDGNRIQALLQKRPKFYSGEKPLGTREFRSGADLSAAEQSLGRAEFSVLYFFQALGLDQPKLSRLLSIYPFELNFQVILSTFLVNGVVKDKPEFEPVSAEDLSVFIERAMSRVPAGKTKGSAPKKLLRKLDALLRDEFLRWLWKRRLEAGIDDESRVREMCQAAFGEMEMELGRLKRVKKINPKLISSIVVFWKQSAEAEPHKKEGKQ